LIGITLATEAGVPRRCAYARIVVLDDDYRLRRRLREAAPAGVSVEGLDGAFDRFYDRLHQPLLRLLDDLGRRRPPEIWWSGQVASCSSTATNLMRNVIYARFARDLAAEDPLQDLLLVCADEGLLRCVARGLREAGVRFRYDVSRAARGWRRLGRAIARAGYCLVEFQRTRRLSRILPAPSGLDPSRPRLILRTWIPEGAFATDGTYRDRSFGVLPGWLRRRGFDVLLVPMFVDLRRPLADWFRRMATSGERFLVPQHFVGWRAALGLLWLETRRFFSRYRGARVDGMDVSAILRHEDRASAFDPGRFRLNLGYPLLKELGRRGIRVDAMVYPFENNAPEKMFILAARRFYPSAQMIGFQHSVWLSRQAGAELPADGASAHPLPDRIVCGGRVYLDVLGRLGFPKRLLVSGPSLRFAHIRDYPERFAEGRPRGQPPVFFLPLPYDWNMSLELLDKLRAAIGERLECHVLVKPHPLLDEAELRDFVGRLTFPSVEFTNASCRDGLLRADVALAIGTSVVHMEAIACGVPLVRVVPDNTFFLDPVKWMDYPLNAVRTPGELLERLRQAIAMTPETLAALAADVKCHYFGEVTDRAMTLFTPNRAGGDGGLSTEVT